MLQPSTAPQRCSNDEAYRVQLGAPLGPPYKALTGFLRAMIGLIPLLILAASGGGYWLGRRALAPVDRVIQDAPSIGHHNLSGRLMVPRTGDELQRLSETLNEMMGRLESAFHRITRFAADASHELRSPVAFVRATAKIALLQPRDPETYRSAVSDVYDEAQRMTELIENLLTLARADAGSSQLKMAPLDVCEPLRQVCSQASVCAKRKNISFSTQLPDADLRVLATRSRCADAISAKASEHGFHCGRPRQDGTRRDCAGSSGLRPAWTSSLHLHRSIRRSPETDARLAPAGPSV